MNNTEHPIDIVIPWVNDKDPEWLAEKEKYSGFITPAVHSYNYQDWGLLKYWFRGIEKNAPWVRKIFFVTCGHLPDWLNTDHPKLQHVTHAEYIPQEYLPTFSANPIENNFHRIADLSEHFIYFNDDMYLIRETKPEDFFRNGLPCDSAIINPIAPANNNTISHMMLTDIAVINTHFKKRDVIKRNRIKWFNLKYRELLLLNFLFIPWSRFPGLLEQHGATSFLKSTFREVWEREYDLLHETSKHRFRDFKNDVNQWLMKEWQIASGKFYPRSIRFCKMILVSDKKTALEARNLVVTKKYKMLCVNDHLREDNYKVLSSLVEDGFARVFPEKSEFEL